MPTPEEKARQIFGERAKFYTTSSAHTDEQVLETVIALCRPETQFHALDIATGTGHTAFALAPFVESVIGLDLTPEMLQEAETLKAQKGIKNVSFQVGDVHQLPFEDARFDLITSRRAPHHFSEIHQAIGEMKRVLKPGGRLVVDDRSVPENEFVDETMNRLDWLHDESHVREYRPSEWKQMLEQAGFTVEMISTYEKHRQLTSLTGNASEANARKILETVNGLTDDQKQLMNVQVIEGEIYTNHWFVMLSAVKPSL